MGLTSFFTPDITGLEGSKDDVCALGDDFEDFRLCCVDKFSTSPRKLWVMSTALLISEQATNGEGYKNQGEWKGVMSDVDWSAKPFFCVPFSFFFFFEKAFFVGSLWSVFLVVSLRPALIKIRTNSVTGILGTLDVTTVMATT